MLFCISESRNHFFIFQNAAVSARTVDFNQVLIYDTSCTDIQVTYFRVAHLSVRQSDIFTACLQLRMRILSQQTVPIRSRGIENHIIFLVVTTSPSVKNH